MYTEKLTKKDQFIVHKHFMRIGVECIWFDDLYDLKAALAEDNACRIEHVITPELFAILKKFADKDAYKD